MTLGLAAVVPPSLSPACADMTIGDAPGCTRADRLDDTGAFDLALRAFAAGFVEPDRAALVSFWSMYYLAALIAPATAALLCRDEALPVGFDEVGVAFDARGIASFRLASAGSPGASHDRRFDTLVGGHLAPFATLCAARGGLAPRVVWSNAAVVLEWVLDELRAVDTLPAARAEAEALLDGRAGACRLAHPLKTRADDKRIRRVCCLRYRLPGVTSCGSLCPRTLHRSLACRPP